MAAKLTAALVSVLTALWPKVEPMVADALVQCARNALMALKAKAIPDTSRFKPLEAIEDKVIDDILALLPPAPAA